LLVHATIYWFYCLFSVTLIAVCWIIFSHQPTSSVDLFAQLWMNCGPALLGSVLLLPLVLLDCLRLSNRFAGPMVRIRQATKELAQGQTPRPVQLREGDFWAEFVDDFNLVIERCTTATSVGSAAATKADVPGTEPARPDAASESVSQSKSPSTPPSGPISVLDLYSDLSV
jgi:hypothetical protein